MNRRTVLCLLAAATLAACGQPPSPGTAQPAPTTEVTTTSTTEATTTTDVAPPATTTTTAQPKPPPPPPRTTTKPPPPPPKPPDRWVLPAGLRGSIEQQTGIPFPQSWNTISGQLAEACPGKKLCVGYTLVVDGSTDTEGDCKVVRGGIKVPDPLHEGGKITFRITNDLCSEG
ncbi:hypothetical protein AB0E59_22205 [Lentzea sp. NPDC034063]|uniref:hypothetical protein n=1 Tax=unclassified Lentzea TaxID=2643253 RepID=UPI0033D3B7D1